MKKLFLFMLLPFLGCSQQNLDQLLENKNNGSVPYITPEKLNDKMNSEDNIIVLDARELKAYEGSHLKDAIYTGYRDFTISNISQSVDDKNSTIVVYCSLGIRSEDIGEKLIEAGYKNVYNLYGGIFEWKNKDYKVFDLTNQSTEKVHAYSKRWGKWLHNAEKVY